MDHHHTARLNPPPVNFLSLTLIWNDKALIYEKIKMLLVKVVVLLLVLVLFVGVPSFFISNIFS